MVRLHRGFPIWKANFSSLESALSLVLVDFSGVGVGYNFRLNNLFSIFHLLWNSYFFYCFVLYCFSSQTTSHSSCTVKTSLALTLTVVNSYLFILGGNVWFYGKERTCGIYLGADETLSSSKRLYSDSNYQQKN